MAVLTYLWPLPSTPAAVPPAGRAVSPTERPLTIGAQAHLGWGLLRPFRRDRKSDIANAGSVELVKAAVGQILGTHCSSDYTVGELPWRTEFGSLLRLLRHRPNDEGQEELARYYVAQALQRWEPRVALRRVAIRQSAAPDGQRTVLEIRVSYNIIRRNVAGNQVILPDVEQVQRVTV